MEKIKIHGIEINENVVNHSLSVLDSFQKEMINKIELRKKLNVRDELTISLEQMSAGLTVANVVLNHYKKEIINKP